jgi:hypothetical protein
MSHHAANTLAVKLFQKARGYWDGKVDPSVPDRIEFVGGDARDKVLAANSSKDMVTIQFLDEITRFVFCAMFTRRAALIKSMLRSWMRYWLSRKRA